MNKIFAAADTRRNQKLARRAIYTAKNATSERLAWSQETVTFDVEDHPKDVIQPGKHALVLDPIVGGCHLSCVLMEGGSGLNIIFIDTLEKMETSISGLQRTDVGFHGVIPGCPVRPLGRIKLEVVFGDEQNYRSEAIQFEVAPFQSSYHVILGRPAYVKFMAVPSYAYLQLKMPGPNSMITVRGSSEKAYEDEVAN